LTNSGTRKEEYTHREADEVFDIAFCSRLCFDLWLELYHFTPNGMSEKEESY
jgi:hypothetical protein